MSRVGIPREGVQRSILKADTPAVSCVPQRGEGCPVF